MRRVFLDTIGLLALWNARDQWHEAARAAFSTLVKERAEFWTTTYVLLECGNAAARTPFRSAVIELRTHMAAAGTLVEPDEEDLATAWMAYSGGKAGDPGIVDEVSFAIMRRLKITDAFTNDRHFRAAGFNILF